MLVGFKVVPEEGGELLVLVFTDKFDGLGEMMGFGDGLGCGEGGGRVGEDGEFGAFGFLFGVDGGEIHLEEQAVEFLGVQRGFGDGEGFGAVLAVVDGEMGGAAFWLLFLLVFVFV